MTEPLSAGTPATSPIPVRLVLNGEPVDALVEERTSLLELIRGLGATGTHVGCEQGVCGACTVLLDNEPVRSCLVLAVQVAECTVTTVEGLGDARSPHMLQEAFSRQRGLQCGYCTPGFLMLAAGLLERAKKKGSVTDEQIRDVLSSNLCRCTGYESIVAAVREVAAQRGLLGSNGEVDQP